MPNIPTNPANKPDNVKAIIARAKEEAKAKMAQKGVATVATQPKAQPKGMPKLPRPKKEKYPRSAEARDARSKARGRLPNNVVVTLSHLDENWSALLTVYADGPPTKSVVSLSAESSGQFDCLEKIDVKFWEWVAKLAPDAPERKLMAWPAATDAGKPDTPASYPTTFAGPEPTAAVPPKDSP